MVTSGGLEASLPGGTPLGGMDVVVLAGGLGTRVRAVLGDTPKLLAPIDGRPFLDLLAEQFISLGAGRLVLSLGFLAEAVERHIAQADYRAQLVTVVEAAPLGTGGALRHLIPTLCGDLVLIVNGDTWIRTDFVGFVAEHRQHGRPISLLGAEVEDVSRYGTLQLARNGTLEAFLEKGTSGRGVVSSGAYLFSRDGLDRLAQAEGASLERDFLASLPAGCIHVYRSPQTSFIDIGTPESLASAASDIAALKSGWE